MALEPVCDECGATPAEPMVLRWRNEDRRADLCEEHQAPLLRLTERWPAAFGGTARGVVERVKWATIG